MEPPAPDRLTADQRVALWLDLMDTGEQLLLGRAAARGWPRR